jgi:hypothetical protein
MQLFFTRRQSFESRLQQSLMSNCKALKNLILGLYTSQNAII